MASAADSAFILRNLVSMDFKVRYRNMSLGVFWSLLNPLVMMTVLTFVFTEIMPSGRENFALFVLIGLLPYNFFSLAWQNGTSSIAAHGALVKKVPFQRVLLPISVVLAASLHYLIQFALLLVAVGWVVGVNPQWAWLPLIVAVEVLFACGAALLFAAFDVYLRDTRYVVESAVLVLFWLLPIFYGFEMIGQEWAWIYELNPLAAAILVTRTVLLDAAAPNPTTLVKLVGVSAAACGVAYLVFQRLEGDFADYL